MENRNAEFQSACCAFELQLERSVPKLMEFSMNRRVLLSFLSVYLSMGLDPTVT